MSSLSTPFSAIRLDVSKFSYFMFIFFMHKNLIYPKNYNVKILIAEVYAFLLLQCTAWAGK